MKIGLTPKKKADLVSASQIIKHETLVPATVLDLLLETYIGTNGAQYQLLNTLERIDQLQNPHFFSLMRNGKAIGNITICERNIQVLQKTTTNFYIRYFTFKTLFQGGEKIGKGKNKFHLYFNTLFSNLNESALETHSEKSIFWAFIDPENTRSFKMKEKFGFESIGTFNTNIFHRFFPKKHSSVQPLKQKDTPLVLEKTMEFYKKYNFLTLSRINHENYFVLKKEGEIVAGIKVFPSAWKIKRLPGKNGPILKRLLPIIPLSKRLINPKQHIFLSSEGFWHKPNVHGKEISRFFEGVLALTNRHSLFLWEDNNSKILSAFKLNWGLMNRIKTDNSIHIIAKMNHYSAQEVQDIKDLPKYLSGFDMT